MGFRQEIEELCKMNENDKIQGERVLDMWASGQQVSAQEQSAVLRMMLKRIEALEEAQSGSGE